MMKDVVRKEVRKWLNTGFIYVISDSPWVSLVYVVPKKGGFTMIRNERIELIPTRIVTGWRVCIDYRKLNTTTRIDHFPLPFIDQMLDILTYVFLMDILDITKFLLHLRTRKKLLSHALMVLFLLEEFHLGYAMLLLLSKDA